MPASGLATWRPRTSSSANWTRPSASTARRSASRARRVRRHRLQHAASRRHRAAPRAARRRDAAVRRGAGRSPRRSERQMVGPRGARTGAIAARRPADAVRHFAAALDTVEKTRSDLMRTDYKLSYLHASDRLLSRLRRCPGGSGTDRAGARNRRLEPGTGARRTPGRRQRPAGCAGNASQTRRRIRNRVPLVLAGAVAVVPVGRHACARPALSAPAGAGNRGSRPAAPGRHRQRPRGSAEIRRRRRRSAVRAAACGPRCHRSRAAAAC